MLIELKLMENAFETFNCNRNFSHQHESYKTHKYNGIRPWCDPLTVVLQSWRMLWFKREKIIRCWVKYIYIRVYSSREKSVLVIPSENQQRNTPSVRSAQRVCPTSHAYGAFHYIKPSRCIIYFCMSHLRTKLLHSIRGSDAYHKGRRIYYTSVIRKQLKNRANVRFPFALQMENPARGDEHSTRVWLIRSVKLIFLLLFYFLSSQKCVLR